MVQNSSVTWSQGWRHTIEYIRCSFYLEVRHIVFLHSLHLLPSVRILCHVSLKVGRLVGAGRRTAQLEAVHRSVWTLYTHHLRNRLPFLAVPLWLGFSALCQISCFPFFKIFINRKKCTHGSGEQYCGNAELTRIGRPNTPFKAFVLGKGKLVCLESSCWLFMTRLVSLRA